jgi:hypothetical protein
VNIKTDKFCRLHIGLCVYSKTANTECDECGEKLFYSICGTISHVS